MKKKWLAAVPALALVTYPFPSQSADASENNMVFPSHVSPELQPILQIVPEHQPILRNGSFGLEVKLIQEKLNHFGLETTVDSLFGPQTASQVRKFQAANGLAVDAIVGMYTWTKLIAKEQAAHMLVSVKLRPLLDIAPEHQPVLEKGSVGLEVELLQERLNHFAFYTPGDGLFGPEVDGVFGRETDAHVRDFQEASELVADGIVGEHTWTALIAAE